MIFAVDTTTIKVVRMRTDVGRLVRRATVHTFADAALPHMVKKWGRTIPTALGVVVGPGAFSATRTGVALINALGFAWRIPVMALTKEQFDAPESLIAPRTRGPVAVVYGKEPNITRKKNK